MPNSQRYDDDVASELQKIRKKAAVQIKDQPFNEKDSILMRNFSAKLRRARNSSGIQKRDSVWLYREYWNGSAIVTIKARLIRSSNDAKRHERTITSYASVVCHVIRRCATDAAIVKAGEEIRSLRKRSLTIWDFYKVVWDLMR